ncbi:DUF4142 domain-containing protein [Shinella pollutisoli]|uniref:DUF4142 domain-containing protein n=1 Tax=Shinella pollutisoli TaxID=2250594 RepID=A0ABV7DGK7_9HYPH|nr:DUF4142 domain-containing protein [Shinella pollutisoli]
MRPYILAFALAAAITPASAQSTAEETGVNSALGIPPETVDFVRMAAQSDMFEIESSKLAVERAQGPVKAFAEKMVQDHQKTSAELKQLLQNAKLDIELPTALSEDHQEALQELGKLQGAEFSEDYVDKQVDAHEDAVDLFKRYGEEGSNADLKTWAAATAPHLQQHLDMARDLDE